MNWKAWIPLAVAIVLGLLAARMAINIVNSKNSEPTESMHTQSIIVAARDIEPGTLLAETDLKLGRVDAGSVPAGAFSAANQVANHVTKIALTANQPLLPTLLAEDGAGYGVGATLPKGMRAITLPIDDVSGVAGFIQPTCRVDVVATIQTEGKPMSKTVLENLQVFAVGGRTGPAQPPQPGQPPEQIRTLTLLVQPEDAEKLDLAINNGRVRLILRNGKDKSVSTSEGATIATLKGGSTRDPFAPVDPTNASNNANTTPAIPASEQQGNEPPQPWVIEVIRGGTTTTQTFNLNKTTKPAPAKAPKDGTEVSDTHQESTPNH